MTEIENAIGTNSVRITQYPRIVFRGFHPDMIYVSDSAGKQVTTPTGPYHSAIALFGYKQGFSIEKTLDKFHKDCYARLGYFQQWDNSVTQLIAEGNNCGLDISAFVDRWAQNGCFMYSINHPKLHVMADLAHLVLSKIGIKSEIANPEDFVNDPLKHGSVWGVYPEIAENRGFRGSYAFKIPGLNGEIHGLRDFIEESFATYSQYTRDELSSQDFDEDKFKYQLVEKPVTRYSIPRSEIDRKNATDTSSHPYSALPPTHFWRKAISSVPIQEVDPVVKSKFTVGPADKIATAGSCFAQHIANRLQGRGYGYFVAEAAASELTEVDAKARNYGVFSARYGNIYTARQLLQLFDRTFGSFDPRIEVWQRPDGRFVDPFRPQIEPEGFKSADEVLAEREIHFEAVRRMFTKLDVFVFTLGLTEAWCSVDEKAVVPLAPGVAGGNFDPSKYEFVNFSAGEIAHDISKFVERLLGVNPSARVILTVSPVPLVATYENRHVLTSTTYSKSALRSAAEDVFKKYDNVDYFPSYEVITGNFNRGAYFENDLRGVTNSGVDHVMRLFFRHYTKENERETEKTVLDPVFDLVCEEEELDRDS